MAISEIHRKSFRNPSQMALGTKHKSSQKLKLKLENFYICLQKLQSILEILPNL